jgi:hypothetical protein
MKTTVNSYDFHRAFETSRPNNFSYEGLNCLFEYLENLEQDTGEEMELDVIAICCDFTEYENLEAFWVDYDREEYPDLESIEENTQLIRVDIDDVDFVNDDGEQDSREDGRFIIQKF